MANTIPTVMEAPAYTQVTIAANASLSNPSTPLNGYRVVGILTDAAWDAAKITFQVSLDGINWFNLYDADGEVVVSSITGAAAISMELNALFGWQYVRVRSGIAATAVNQVDATVVTLVTRRL